jgi:hypothetical protein
LNTSCKKKNYKTFFLMSKNFISKRHVTYCLFQNTGIIGSRPDITWGLFSHDTQCICPAGLVFSIDKGSFVIRRLTA